MAPMPVEIQVPQQRNIINMQEGYVGQGDWVLVSRELNLPAKQERSGYTFWENRPHRQLFRGQVKMTPATTPRHEVYKSRSGTEVHIPRLPIFHIAEVHLIEFDGELSYDRYPDLLLDPKKSNFTIELFDRSDSQAEALATSH